ncbi:1276_t:CDS:2 [Funneliformis geosporum]|uniref:3527_t:CDS:1 n=1 Tax=Funneliformis geosporum TaxID=1117311 RepID=A0A9W4SGR8_9GLOM|nr:3527_t:CDS:2 [Funneliformis geosporum]CAI2185006.1 1276_t:CDS:2 [Funneliformis geosporum]
MESFENYETENYPEDPHIKYQKRSNGGTFYYEVIEVGFYPNEFKTTRGDKRMRPYPIPTNYKIKTTYGRSVKQIITCSINYDENHNPIFKIDWMKKDENFQVISKKSATEATTLYLRKLLGEDTNTKKSGVIVFGLQLSCLKKFRENEKEG